MQGKWSKAIFKDSSLEANLFRGNVLLSIRCVLSLHTHPDGERECFYEQLRPQNKRADSGSVTFLRRIRIYVQ